MLFLLSFFLRVTTWTSWNKENKKKDPWIDFKPDLVATKRTDKHEMRGRLTGQDIHQTLSLSFSSSRHQHHPRLMSNTQPQRTLQKQGYHGQWSKKNRNQGPSAEVNSIFSGNQSYPRVYPTNLTGTRPIVWYRRKHFLGTTHNWTSSLALSLFLPSFAPRRFPECIEVFLKQILEGRRWMDLRRCFPGQQKRLLWRSAMDNDESVPRWMMVMMTGTGTGISEQRTMMARKNWRRLSPGTTSRVSFASKH